MKPPDAAKREAPMPSRPLDAQLQAMVESAVADLAHRQGPEQPATADALEVLQAEHVTWRSGAMGCPLPDRAYMMVLTPGVRILLRAGEEEFEYHGARGGKPFLCEPPGVIETPAPGHSSLDPT